MHLISSSISFIHYYGLSHSFCAISKVHYEFSILNVTSKFIIYMNPIPSFAHMD